jgi:hypothetical protein
VTDITYNEWVYGVLGSGTEFALKGVGGLQDARQHGDHLCSGCRDESGMAPPA